MSETPSYPALIELINRLEGKDKKTCELALSCLNRSDKRDKKLREELQQCHQMLVAQARTIRKYQEKYNETSD